MNKVKDPSIRRNSTRLPHYDYSQDGAYFVTIVTQNRLCLFGEILDGEMLLNAAGRMIEQVCQELPGVIRGVEIGCFQIMPNHFHAIIWLTQDGGAEMPKPTGGFDVGATLNESPQGSGDNPDQPEGASDCPDQSVGATLCGCPGQTRRSAPTYRKNAVVNDNHDQNTIKSPTEGLHVKRVSLSNIVQRFKSLTTRRYIEGVRQSGWPHFPNRLWQRNYYEHVIRDEADLQAITDYILQNPQNWEKDEEFRNSEVVWTQWGQHVLC